MSLILCLAYFKNLILYLTPSYLKPFSGSQVTHRTMSKCLSLPLSKARMMCPELVYLASSRTAIFSPHRYQVMTYYGYSILHTTYNILQSFPTNHDNLNFSYTSARVSVIFPSQHKLHPFLKCNLVTEVSPPLLNALLNKFSNHHLPHHLNETVPIKVTLNLLVIKSSEHFLVFICLDFAATFDTVN